MLIQTPPSPRLITKLLTAERCRRSLYEFTKEMWDVIEPGNKFIDGWHVEAICDHLQAVIEGKFQHLLICIPPGFAKSTIASVMWQCWTWVNYPHIRALFGSYDEKLTHRDADKCRGLITSRKFIELFEPDWKINPNSNTKSYYENTMFGSRKTYYMKSSKKTGWRGNFVLVDDALSAEDRYDKIVKRQCNSTWDTVLPSRVNRQQVHGFIVIMQRLAEDDLVGHIIEKYGDLYVKLILPNEYDPKRRCVTPIFSDPRTEDGELLCPGLVSQEDTEEFKVSLGPVDYGAQYQHNPIPLGGNRFKASDFLYWKPTAHPSTLTLVNREGKLEHVALNRCTKFMSVDFAASEKTEADFTSIGLWAFTHKYDLILLYRLSMQEDEYGIIQALKSIYDMPMFGNIPPAFIAAEDNGLGLPIAQSAQNKGLPVIFVHVSKDLLVRSANAAVRVVGGQVYFPQYDTNPWMHEFTQQLTSYPGGKNDDDVSMFSIAANAVYLPKPDTPGIPSKVIKGDEGQKPRINANRIQTSTNGSRNRLFGKR